jgi:glycosyltransferase 2 family protein
MTGSRARRIAAVIVLLLVATMLVVAVRRLDAARIADALRVVRTPWVVLAMACYATILPMWATQWRLLAPQVPRNTWRCMLGIVAMASSTHNTTAFFMGEATSALLLSTRAGLAAPEIVSVMAMDQLLVGLAKIGVLVAAAVTLTLPDWLTAGIVTLAAGVVALLVVTLLGAWHYETIVGRARRFVPERGLRALHGAGRALQPLRSPRRGGISLVLAAAKMAAELSAILAIQRAFGVDLPPASAFLVLAGINMATLVPLVPANLGVYEGAIVLIYTRLGIATELAVSMAVVQHACYFVALALPGYAWFGRVVVAQRATAAS